MRFDESGSFRPRIDQQSFLHGSDTLQRQRFRRSQTVTRDWSPAVKNTGLNHLHDLGCLRQIEWLALQHVAEIRSCAGLAMIARARVSSVLDIVCKTAIPDAAARRHHFSKYACTRAFVLCAHNARKSSFRMYAAKSDSLSIIASFDRSLSLSGSGLADLFRAGLSSDTAPINSSQCTPLTTLIRL